MTEIGIGYVKDGGRLNPRDDEDSEELKKYYGEHFYDRGWIADVAGLVICNRSRMKSMRLHELIDTNKAGPYLTWLCEVKVSKSDFAGDDKWRKPPQAHLQFIACPWGLIPHGRIPRGWGLLEVGGREESGGRVYKNMNRLSLNEISHDQVFDIMRTLVWAMWWRKGQDAVLRDAQIKVGNPAENRRDSGKVSGIVNATAEYIAASSRFHEEGGESSLSSYLKGYGVKRRVARAVERQVTGIRLEFTRLRRQDRESTAEKPDFIKLPLVSEG